MTITSVSDAYSELTTAGFGSLAEAIWHAEQGLLTVSDSEERDEAVAALVADLARLLDEGLPST